MTGKENQYLKAVCTLYWFQSYFDFVCNIKVLFIHQLMHHWVVLKGSIKIYIKIYIKTAPTCFGAVTPSSGSALIRAN